MTVEGRSTFTWRSSLAPLRWTTSAWRLRTLRDVANQAVRALVPNRRVILPSVNFRVTD